ncbi:MAG: hypothetical protein GYB17_08695 [Gammaproteobacteria bacterium]|nr:hypothetical protein [Gammaproteobacteria bacterium]
MLLHASLDSPGGDLSVLSLLPQPPCCCDTTYDERIRDSQGNYLSIARLGEDSSPPLAPLDRASQLFAQALPSLLAQQPFPPDADYRATIQLPDAIDEDAWFDRILGLWPIRRQPRHDIATTRLTFDQWLAAELADDSDTTPWRLFIAVAPLTTSSLAQPSLAEPLLTLSSPPVSPAADQAPPGEAVAALWLKRIVRGQPTAPHDAATLSLGAPVCPATTSPPPTSRRDHQTLSDTWAPLLHKAERIVAIVWDGDRRGHRLDRILAAIQHDIPECCVDTDLWTLDAVTGDILGATSAAQVALAVQLAHQRQGNVLVVDTRSEDRPRALLLRAPSTTGTPA